MTTDKKPKHWLIAEIDSILGKRGKSFDSAVRDFHSYCCDNQLCEDDSIDESNRWVEKFKKYRLRIDQNKKAKPYRELEKFRDYLKEENKISPQPLLHLVENDPICNIMKKLSTKIRTQIESEKENSEP